MAPKKPLTSPTMRDVTDLLTMDMESNQTTTTASVNKIKVNLINHAATLTLEKWCSSFTLFENTAF